MTTEDPFGNPTFPLPEVEEAATTPSPEAEKAPEPKTKRSSGRSSTMALNGQPVDLSDFPEAETPSWDERGHRYSELMNYVPEEEFDITDVQTVNREILHARRRLFRVQRALADANRKAAEAKFEYRRKRARVLVGISGGTEKTREATADVACEEEFGNLLVAEQLADELLNQSRAVKAELDSLANLSHNIRAQMAIQ